MTASYRYQEPSEACLGSRYASVGTASGSYAIDSSVVHVSSNFYWERLGTALVFSLENSPYPYVSGVGEIVYSQGCHPNTATVTGLALFDE